jgi:ABC-type dipeptide/oligopeptide/nickel transport system ATPase component
MVEDNSWSVEVSAELVPLPSSAAGAEIASRFGVERMVSRSMGGGTLALDSGEIGVLLGPSGSGKSVLLAQVREATVEAVCFPHITSGDSRNSMPTLKRSAASWSIRCSAVAAWRCA